MFVVCEKCQVYIYDIRLLCIFVGLTEIVKRGVLILVDRYRAIEITTIIIIVYPFV